MRETMACAPCALALSLPALLWGQSRMAVKSGWSVSAFRGRNQSLKPGVVLAVGKEWSLRARTSLSLEVAYVTRGGIFRDKLLGGDFWPTPLWWRSQVCSLGFIELPLRFRYQLKPAARWRWQLVGGRALALAVHDNSEVLRSEEIANCYDPSTGRPMILQDYVWWDGDGLFSPTAENSSFVVHVGLSLKRGFYHAELGYARPLGDLSHAGGVDLDGKPYHALAFTLGVWLPKKAPRGHRETGE